MLPARISPSRTEVAAVPRRIDQWLRLAKTALKSLRLVARARRCGPVPRLLRVLHTPAGGSLSLQAKRLCSWPVSQFQ